MKLFNTVADLGASGYLFRIMDNGGASFDRYTVLFCDGDYLGLSSNPSSPVGFSQWGEGLDPAVMNEWADEKTAVDLQLGDLSPELQQHILARVNQAWQDALDAIEARDAAMVAKSRDTADVNEGIHDSAGKGIYAAGCGFCVKLDNGDHGCDDRGPFMTAAQALAATLPDDYSLSGPEYHSPVGVGSLRKTPGLKRRLAALEKRVDAA